MTQVDRFCECVRTSTTIQSDRPRRSVAKSGLLPSSDVLWRRSEPTLRANRPTSNELRFQRMKDPRRMMMGIGILTIQRITLRPMILFSALLFKVRAEPLMIQPAPMRRQGAPELGKRRD